MILLLMVAGCYVMALLNAWTAGNVIDYATTSGEWWTAFFSALNIWVAVDLIGTAEPILVSYVKGRRKS